MLDKVFGIEKAEATKIALNVDRLGSALVYTGSAEEANEKLEMVRLYNEASSNNLAFSQEDHGAYEQPQRPAQVTQGASLTLQFVNYTPDVREVYHVLGGIVSAGNLPISKSEGQDLSQDLVDGREILLKGFGADPQGQIKAEILKDLIISSLGFDGEDPDVEQEEIDNVVFSVRSQGHTLKGPNKLISEQAQADSIFLDGIGDIGSMIGDAYNKQLLEKYGTVEEFLKVGSQEEIDEYNSIQEGLSELGGLVNKKKGKLTP